MKKRKTARVRRRSKKSLDDFDMVTKLLGVHNLHVCLLISLQGIACTNIAIACDRGVERVLEHVLSQGIIHCNEVLVSAELGIAQFYQERKENASIIDSTGAEDVPTSTFLSP